MFLYYPIHIIPCGWASEDLCITNWMVFLTQQKQWDVYH